MNYKKCVYFVEGPCEEKLINALNKVQPYLLNPGKPNVHNVVQELIPRNTIIRIPQGTTVVFVFDTDIEKTDILKRNIEHVKTYVGQVKLVNIAEVWNFEDELVRATDVTRVQDFTKSASVKDFKADFCRMKNENCRNALKRHHFDFSKLWVTKPPKSFSFIKQGVEKIRVNKK